ncbi:unnamed protein product, partial [marine sediment metagenome]
ADDCIGELVGEGVKVNDVRKELYPKFNDFNDFLCGRKVE